MVMQIYSDKKKLSENETKLFPIFVGSKCFVSQKIINFHVSAENSIGKEEAKFNFIHKNKSKIKKLFLV